MSLGEQNWRLYHIADLHETGSGVHEVTPLRSKGHVNHWMVCQLVRVPSTGLELHAPHNLKDVGKEKTHSFLFPCGGILDESNDNTVQIENKRFQLQVASEKFPEITNPQEDPQTCYLSGVSMIMNNRLTWISMRAQTLIVLSHC